MIRPIRIEPADIRVTLECPASDLRKIRDYIEQSLPWTKRVYQNSDDEESQRSLEFVEGEFLPLLKKLLDDPMISGGG